MKKMKIPGTDLTIGHDEPAKVQGPTPDQFARALGKEYDGYVQAMAEIDMVEYKVLRHVESNSVRVFVGHNDITAVISESMLRAFGERAGVQA